MSFDIHHSVSNLASDNIYRNAYTSFDCKMFSILSIISDQIIKNGGAYIVPFKLGDYKRIIKRTNQENIKLLSDWIYNIDIASTCYLDGFSYAEFDDHKDDYEEYIGKKEIISYNDKQKIKRTMEKSINDIGSTLINPPYLYRWLNTDTQGHPLVCAFFIWLSDAPTTTLDVFNLGMDDEIRDRTNKENLELLITRMYTICNKLNYVQMLVKLNLLLFNKYFEEKMRLSSSILKLDTYLISNYQN